MSATVQPSAPPPDPYDPNIVLQGQKGVQEEIAAASSSDASSTSTTFKPVKVSLKAADGTEEVLDLTLDVLSPAEIKNIISELVHSNVITQAAGEEVLGQIFSPSGDPVIPAPKDKYEGMAVNDGNEWFNANPLVAMSVAFAAMWKTGQLQKILEKNIELKERQISFSMSQESAKLQIELGDLKAQEHMYRALAIGVTAAASAGAALAMPRAAENLKGASQMAFMKMLEGAGQAMSELISSTYAPLQAAVEALKTVKDSIIQQLNSFADNAQQASKENQDLINELMNKFSELEQKLKDAFTTRA